MPASLKLPAARRVSDGLFLVVMCLIGLSLAGQFSKYVLGHPKLLGFVPAFYVDYESTVPTWYSSAALGLAGLLMLLIAVIKVHAGDRFRWHWAGLAALLFFLSADEVAMFHELPIDPLRETFGTRGLLYFPWVVPGIVCVGLVVVAYLRFFLKLPPRTQKLLMLATVAFVGGAIGVEMVSAAQSDYRGEENLTYAMIITTEEFLEMIGVVVLVRALLEYIEHTLGGCRIELSGA